MEYTVKTAAERSSLSPNVLRYYEKEGFYRLYTAVKAASVGIQTRIWNGWV